MIKFLKYFILIFLVFLFIFNWNDLSWVFSYRTVSTLLSDFFKTEVYEDEIIYSDNYTDKKNSIEIPKIEITAPLVIVESSDPNKVYQSLDKGVVIWPESKLPGQVGQTILLGHSSPPNWPKIKHDWVFTKINELEKENEVIIYFNNEKFSYRVKDKIFLERGEEVPNDLTNLDKDTIILISCWPPGKDVRRIAVVAIR